MPPEDGHPRGLVNRREGANGWRRGTNVARSQDPGERGGPGDGPEEMPDDQRALDVGRGADPLPTSTSRTRHAGHRSQPGAALPSTGHTRQSCLQTEGCRTRPSSSPRARRGLPRSLLSPAPVPSPPAPPGSWGASRRQAPPPATWPPVPQAQRRGGPESRPELQQPEERGTGRAQAEPLLGAAIHAIPSPRYGHRWAPPTLASRASCTMLSRAHASLTAAPGRHGKNPLRLYLGRTQGQSSGTPPAPGHRRLAGRTHGKQGRRLPPSKNATCPSLDHPPQETRRSPRCRPHPGRAAGCRRGPHRPHATGRPVTRRKTSTDPQATPGKETPACQVYERREGDGEGRTGQVAGEKTATRKIPPPATTGSGFPGLNRCSYLQAPRTTRRA